MWYDKSLHLCNWCQGCILWVNLCYLHKEKVWLHHTCAVLIRRCLKTLGINASLLQHLLYPNNDCCTTELMNPKNVLNGLLAQLSANTRMNRFDMFAKFEFFTYTFPFFVFYLYIPFFEFFTYTFPFSQFVLSLYPCLIFHTLQAQEIEFHHIAASAEGVTNLQHLHQGVVQLLENIQQ